MQIADWAIAYVERIGWPVFPAHSIRSDGRCSCMYAACHSPGKHPRTPQGVCDATLDVDQIIAWWRRWPTANIGLAGGRWWALDVDGIDGENQLAALLAARGPLPECPIAITGSGGYHMFFASDSRVGNRVRFVAGLDTRSAGGYVIAAPSNHASGRRYTWLKPPRKVLPAAPEWIVELVSRKSTTIPAPPPVPPPTDAMRRASRYLAALEPSISGQGGHLALWRAAQVLVRRFCLPRAQALYLLTAEFNPRCQPPWSERELEHKVRQAEQVGQMRVGIEDRSR
jgi:hypothetical protein